MSKRGIGAELRRLEDARLLTGHGCYSDDFTLPNQARSVVLRSPHPHARIVSIDTARAAKMPGVLLILTGADVATDGLRPVPHIPTAMSPPDIALYNLDGSELLLERPMILATETVRHVGEAVAFIVAETVAEAKDAAEAIEVVYEPLKPISDIAVDARVGNPPATRAGFAEAEHVVRLETHVQRVTGVPMEPRAALGVYDPASGRYTLHAGGGAVVRPKKELAIILGIEPEMVRVIAKEVGGNFGTRNYLYPEFVLVAWAAKKIGRPVKWNCERGEAFLSDYAGRDLTVEVELALSSDGQFHGLHSTNTSNVGAYTASYIPLTKGTQLMTSLYRMPAVARARAVLSNTVCTAPYRSAGRPETMFVIERLIDMAAREIGMDRVELRRRNLITTLPHRNAFGITYDSGDYVGTLDHALQLADWNGYAERQKQSAARGLKRGLGLGGYVESQSGAPLERAEVTVRGDGTVEVVIGTLSSGQGHATSFAQLVEEWLGIPAGDVIIETSDSDRVSVGGGSHSGRSMRQAGTTIDKASRGIIAKGTRLAAEQLEASEADIAFADGRFTVKGTDRSVGLVELAAKHGSISDAGDVNSRVGSYPYGWHVCEVEIDPDTGVVRIDRYTTVDDVGRAVNPLILHGQTHGGIAQGAGQALMEHVVYDNGQLVTGSFMDYAMPHADDFPSFVTALSEVPSTTHPLGFRGGGEGGITPALGVIVNAVVDALAEYGVSHVEMPCTPERVWRAIRAAQS
ncbi:MAG: xanthine dehydrogenase family protein molybdopterin-binding subunit [Reyranella sp.]|uniref:xanthine dehydrogenase family protein molybdopterin-binding subunit n=1 Tax=Reyranella sp. TaxID=1929291 RepID=UPI001AC123B0|nr:xanthine dehydrogenase family protein molybdopterin-binding subunit [Reyranella sp.]MBN9086126.1 xanthine dehydrogenase family protein molybdopterin-binding subunit [Reyranella sp.]